MTYPRVFIGLCFLVGVTVVQGQSQSPENSGLAYTFVGHYGQVEVGGRYVGAEFHNSRPLPSRISFYYPVANSVDLSTDYWKRDESQPMSIGIQIGKNRRHWIGREPWSYTVSPHKVVFRGQEDAVEYSVTYEFCLNEPAMVRRFTVKNISRQPQEVTAYTFLKTILRTCQTYARKESAWTSINRAMNTIQVDFDDPETDRASIFVQNVGLQPSSCVTDASELAVSDTGTLQWISSTARLSGSPQISKKHLPVAAFEYHQEMKPGDTLSIIQVIGSCKRSEVGEITKRLASSWEKEIKGYDELVVEKSEMETQFKTNDPVLDASAIWAKGILTANAHYINTRIVPMPCPAEYNFFFTHDLLMTDLGAVNFDAARVKKDLLYVESLAKDDIIPHAYYWRDHGFTTEYCTPDNWNHFWFVIVTGAYLRHSLDELTVRKLYPCVGKSLEEVLTQLKPDHLMYAFRPDWWDIGHIEGPRAYMTALAIRSLREYLSISSFLHERTRKLNEYESLADSMQNALTHRLWDDRMNYLVNYNEGKKDEHYYMGSLVAVAYDLLDVERAQKLVQTATEKLLDRIIGVRTAMPPDFHTREVIQFYRFAGEEAGKPFFYANGGVWPHDNAWYAIALNAIGSSDEALKFVKTTMTIDGIIHSPRGQPAMYEYRYDDSTSNEYGMVDKPCFLWAGGFYLKTLYTLFGVRENEWNLSLECPLPSGCDSVAYTLTDGNSKRFVLSGKGKYLESLTFGQISVPSLVLPTEFARETQPCVVRFGIPKQPYLKSINATVEKVVYERPNGIHCEIESFRGHRISAVVISPSMLKKVEVDGVPVSAVRTTKQPDGIYESTVQFGGADTRQLLRIIF
ncbi:MAG: amylo-alpha-1,6-glucosidase [Bacteroidota bacterium]